MFSFAGSGVAGFARFGRFGSDMTGQPDGHVRSNAPRQTIGYGWRHLRPVASIS
jgi:hypothetical protein